MVIDTMVFAYALLHGEDYFEQALSTLELTEQIIVPDSLFAELGNVVWQWIQCRQLPLEIGHAVLLDAEALVDKVVPTVMVRDLALELAVEQSHSFYDAVFVATSVQEQTKQSHSFYDAVFVTTSVQEQTKLLTYDVKLAKKFSEQVNLLK